MPDDDQQPLRGLEILDDATRQLAVRDALKADKIAQIAETRWTIAKNMHKTEQGMPLDFDRWPFLVEIYQNKAQYLVLVGASGWGKAQSIDSMIMTPMGLLRMGDAKIGMIICTPDRKNAMITGIFPQGILQLYEIETVDGRKTKACGQHLWEYELTDIATGLRARTIDLIQNLNAGQRIRIPIQASNGYESSREIKSITPCGSGEAQCIMIDHPRHLYITDDGICTSNTEYMIVDDAASAIHGMRVFHVMENAVKRDKFVAGRIDPCFLQIPIYKSAMKAAQARNASVGNSRFKHFSDGSLNFVGSETPADFTTHRADKSTVDEHQGCNTDNLNKIFNRMTGSDFGFVTIGGNPREKGTPQNQNLDWEWQQTDMRQWNIPCYHCAEYQVLSWWVNFVEQKTNQFGGIISVKVIDPEWEYGKSREPRPMCRKCHRPMNRLSGDGRWIPTHPGRVKVGFQLSSLYNPTVDVNKLYDRYVNAIPDPGRFQDFVNDQLGEAYTSAGSKITVEMMDRASTGLDSGIDPYKLVPAGMLNWG